MIPQILKAVMNEIKLLLEDKGGTIILKTDYNSSNIQSYSMPLIVVDLIDAPDSMQYPGGATRVDWDFALNVYNMMPNPTIDSDNDYSLELLEIIDTVRRHFTKGIWLGTGMSDVESDYCFKFTLSGILSADALEGNGLIMGYKIILSSCALDIDTSLTKASSEVLQTVHQINNPPFS